MSRCRVFLAGEGPSDIGDLANHGHYRRGREGFLQPILRKLVGDRELEFDGMKLTHLAKAKVRTPAGLFRRHAAQAHAAAEVEECSAVVFTCDVDRTPGSRAKPGEAKKRMRELADSIERGFEDARRRGGTTLATAAATPCRMIESWALGDPEALASVTGKAPEECECRGPEELWGTETDPGGSHPKRVLERIVGASPDFAAIAAAADPAKLERSCPLSFAPFARRVRSANAACDGMTT